MTARAIFDRLTGDPGRRAVVWLAWAAMLALATGFVGQFGRNLPANDEWAFVPDLFAPADHQLRWAFERHADHRYPLARLLFVASFRLGGCDFRPALWVSLGVTAAAAACLIASARRLRGGTGYADALYPVLLLHRGHCEDQLMGYQLAFTLTLLGVCGFVFDVAVARTRRRAGLWLAAVGGGPGAVFAPLLGGWAAWRGWAARRWAVVGLAAVVVGYSGWALADAATNPHAGAKNPPAVAAAVTLQAAEGIAGHSFASVGVQFGAAVLLATGGVAGALAWAARKPTQRPCAVGLLAVLAGAVAVLAAVGLSRPNGQAFRFTTFSQLLPVVGLLATARFLPARRVLTITSAVLTLVIAVLVVRQNWGDGRDYARLYAEAHDAAARDAAAGVPLDLLAERNVYYFSTGTGEQWRALWEHRVGPAAAAPPPRAFRTEPTTLRPVPAPDAPAAAVEPGFPVWAVDVPTDKRLAAVRVRFAMPHADGWVRFRFHWIITDPDGTPRPHTESLRRWSLAGDGTTVIWIDGQARGVWIEAGAVGWPVELRGADLLFPEDRP